MRIRSTNRICVWLRPSSKCRLDRRHLGRGFGAAVAVVLISTGTLALSVAVLGAVAAYSDSVDRDEWRIQADLNRKACKDSGDLIMEKDVFATGAARIPEFDCILDL